MSSNGLSSRPLSDRSTFDWVFLVELLTTALLTVFFLFYFNRVFSTVIFYGIRAFTWRSYRAYIDVQSLQISLLGGRIFFKGLRYHAHNETILVHSGFVTWRYWLRKVREAEVHIVDSRASGKTSGGSQDDGGDTEEKGGALASNKKLPCRIEVKVSGVEAFLYNRSPAYDYILQNIARRDTSDRGGSDVPDLSEKNDLAAADTTSSESSKPTQYTDSPVETPDSPGRTSTTFYRKPPLPAFLRIFPIHVECKRAAAVLGNDNTRSILIVKIDGAAGVFDAAGAGPLDVYRQIFSFDVQHPVITMKPNVDFKETQLSAAVRLKEEAKLGIPGQSKATLAQRLFRRPRRTWHALQLLVSSARMSSDSLAKDGLQDSKARKATIIPGALGLEQWQGLARYLEDDFNDEHNEWDPIEYARSSTLADISRVLFTFYWDVPGPVSGLADGSATTVQDGADDVNGSTPPGYGMNLHVYAGQVSYGPWADRHRMDFQSYFFPPSYVDAVPGKRLSAGQYREFSVFKLFLILEEDVTVRLPFRESSKDWRWKGQAEGMLKKASGQPRIRTKGRHKLFNRDKAGAAPNVRPFGWLDVKVSADSTVSLSQDMIPRKDGYRNRLIGDIKGTEMTSSVNHGLLWRSGNFALDLDLSYPLGWNAVRDWRFDVIGKDLDVFILRDHLFLLTDLIMDWSSGPPPDFHTFVPFVYRLNLDFHQFKLNLNTNDANIVNDPSNFDDNNFIILGGGRLFGEVRIPLDNYRPVKNEIPFSVKGLDFFLDQVMPAKSTLGTFPDQQRIATLDEVTLKGSHSAFQDTSIALTDTLVFDIHGTRFLIIMYGWLAHYFVRIKENYFGDDLHFRTLEEYQRSLAEGSDLKDFLADRASNRGNDLDVILAIRVDEAVAALPGSIYTVDEGVAVDIPFATVDLRINNYYMDLHLDLSPFSLSKGKVVFEKNIPHCQTGQTQIFLDGVKLMGQRFFGLPPAEPAYVNTWDVDVGDLTGELQEDFLCILSRVVQAFVVSAPDAENTLAVAHPVIIHDVVFLTLTTSLVRLAVRVGQDALLVSLNDTSVEFNDLAGRTFSSKVNVVVPEVVVACVGCAVIPRTFHTAAIRTSLPTHAHLKTSLSLNVLQRQAHFRLRLSEQQTHIRMSDQRTRRVAFLVPDESKRSSTGNFAHTSRVESAASITPGLPHPIFNLESFVSEKGGPFRSMTSLGESGSGTTTSSCHGARKPLRRQGSKASFAASVQQANSGADGSESLGLMGRPNRFARPNRRRLSCELGNITGPESFQQGRARRSSVAFTSPIAPPFFPIFEFELDVADLPGKSADKATTTFSTGGDETLFFDDRTTDVFDDSLDHTSLIVSAASGVRAFFTPTAVEFALNALSVIQPNTMDDALDALHAGVLVSISDHDKQRMRPGSSLDMSVKLSTSFVRLIQPGLDGKDVLDLELAPTALALKVVSQSSNRTDEDSLSMHLLLSQLRLSLSNMSGRHAYSIAMQIQVREILLWMVQKQSLSVNLTLRELELVTSASNVDYGASVVERTMILVEGFATHFARLAAERVRRLQYLAFHLTKAGERIPDPPFLTRLSYAMRASESHLRNHDSWRILSRLRYVLQSMASEQKRLLDQGLIDPSVRLPEDAESEVMRFWNQQRAWDNPQVRNSIAFRAIYDKSRSAPPSTAQASLPLDLALRAARLGVVLDSGPHQSDFVLGNASLALSVVPPTAPSGLMLETDGPQKVVIAQLNSRSVMLHVDWQLSELVERLVNVVLETEKYHTALRNAGAWLQDASKPASTWGSSYQVVLAVEDLGVSLLTPNLRNENTAKGLKLSLLGSETSDNRPDQAVSALLQTATATIDLFSHDRQLLRLQSHVPNLLVAQATRTDRGQREEEVKIAGGAAAVLVQVREGLLGLVDVADAVIRDEAAHIKQLSEKVLPLIATGPISSDRSFQTFPRLTIALEMESYRLDVALLQSLSYSFTGKTGRLLVIPDLQKRLALKVAIDLENHHHYLAGSEELAKEQIAVLDLPSINVQVLLIQDDDRSPLTIESSLITEVINVDASALHGLAETLKRPELRETLSALKTDISNVQDTYHHVFPATTATPATSRDGRDAPMLDYRVNVMLAGVTVTAAASTLTNHAQARLEFGVARVQAAIFNRASNTNSLLPIPEIHALVGRVFADLKVITQAETRHSGDMSVGLRLRCLVRVDDEGAPHYDYKLLSDGLKINLIAETASAVVDIVNQLQDRFKDLDLTQEKRYLQRLQRSRRPALGGRMTTKPADYEHSPNQGSGPHVLFTSAVSIKLTHTEIRWAVGNSVPVMPGYFDDDLVFSIRRIELNTRSEDTARLTITDLQLAMLTPAVNPFKGRPWNSALLPEVVFNVAHRSTARERSVWLNAAGKSLEVLLEPRFILPAIMLERSITIAVEKVRTATATWQATPTAAGNPRKNPFGNKRLGSLIVDADFAGATIHLQGRKVQQARRNTKMLGVTVPQQDPGIYAPAAEDRDPGAATIRSPGLGVRVQYCNAPEQSLNIEVQLDASSNTLYPTIVPLIIEISDTVKEVMRHSEDHASPQSGGTPTRPAQSFLEESDILAVDPASLLGGIQLNVGLRVREQDFTLSCQPVARVAATTRFAGIYVTANSVRSGEHGHFFALSLAIDDLQASVQHVYSRESTFSFDTDSIVLSLMNSKHLHGRPGLSAMLKVSPMRLQVNARQLQDFLLFREIWFPQEIRQRQRKTAELQQSAGAPEEYLVARYQQIAEAAAFPWTATVLFQEMSIDLDLGQAIGKSSLRIIQLWASSKKTSNWEQNLCIGADSIGIDSTGRMSGLIELDHFGIRTSITWPQQEGGLKQTPRIQASAGFERLRLKAAFDYQAFAIADITAFDFMMYNLRVDEGLQNDRLVAVLNGGRVQVYLTATAAAQVVALVQAFERLVQDNSAAYEQSLKDVEKFLRRKSAIPAQTMQLHTKGEQTKVHGDSEPLKAPISLHTDVVVTLQALSFGAFPSSLTDNQVLLFEALDAQARFAVALEGGRIHSGLGMTLGQLKVALASIQHPAGSGAPKAVGDIAIDDVVSSVVKGAKGGTILRVPRVVATMQTWQSPEQSRIDYVFKSSFEGKVDVGWNFSRISFIRGMWAAHSRSLAARLGKPLPESAVKIRTDVEEPSMSGRAPEDGAIEGLESRGDQQKKITAVVNMPQSKYEYRALEPPIIETPQLRDMGEATPPLEWIGLHRDKLPNVTHQVIIIALLEVAKEVEDAYGKILGRS